MEEQNDIRWLQQYSNYHKVCRKLLEVTEGNRALETLSELEREGLVQRFEYTFELAWKVLQDLMIYKGYEFMSGPNGALKMAFEDGLLSNQDGWRKMAKSRNTLSLVYDEDEADIIIKLVFDEFAPLLKQLDEKLFEFSQEENYQQP